MECVTLRIISSVSPKIKDSVSNFQTTFSRIRQYPLYSKTEPPASLAKHFEPGVFDKSQNYGKDKAKFALFSGIFKQLLDSFMLQCGFYAWSWGVSQSIMTKIGYGQGCEVSSHTSHVFRKETSCSFQNPANRFLSLSCLFSSSSSFRPSRHSHCKSMELLSLKRSTVSTRPPPCSSSLISSRDGPWLSYWVHLFSLCSCTSSNGLVTVLSLG